MLHRASSKTIAAATAVLACWAPAAIAQTHADGTAPQHLAVVVLDESKLPDPDARVEIKSGDNVIAAASTNDTGNAEFRCEPGRYSVRASKQGFETAVVQEFECKEVAQAPMELTLKAAANKQTVEVHDTLSATEVSSVPTATPITTVNSGAKVLDAAVANKIQPATKAAAASHVLRRMRAIPRTRSTLPLRLRSCQWELQTTQQLVVALSGKRLPNSVMRRIISRASAGAKQNSAENTGDSRDREMEAQVR